MAPRNRHCPVCHTHIWFSHRTGNWYAKDGNNCTGETLRHAEPAPTEAATDSLAVSEPILQLA